MANIAMTAADILKWIAWGPVSVQRFHGYNNQAGTLYIQLHEITPKSDGTVTAGSVPKVKSFQVLAGLPFSFEMVNDITMSELVVCISSTEANYTAVAAAGGLDMTVTVASDFLCDGTEVVVGDLTTTVNTLQAWAEAAGPNSLLTLKVTELLNTDNRYIVIEATDADANVPEGRIFPLPKNTTVNKHFGTRGEFVMSQTTPVVVPGTPGAAIAPSLKQGCTIRIVDGVSFPWNQSANTGYIRAVYRPNA